MDISCSGAKQEGGGDTGYQLLRGIVRVGGDTGYQLLRGVARDGGRHWMSVTQGHSKRCVWGGVGRRWGDNGYKIYLSAWLI